MTIKTKQSEFWRGEFGLQYTQRNLIDYKKRIAFFKKILSLTDGVKSVLEIGANRGHNLKAFLEIDPLLDIHGLELNDTAFECLGQVPNIHAYRGSVHDFQPDRTFDIVFTCGVLIHINPDLLAKVYEQMLHWSAKYILVCEYFSPRPEIIQYGGEKDTLFKRDFASEILDMASGKLNVIDYGFLWRRLEPTWDDVNWFLMRKNP